MDSPFASQAAGFVARVTEAQTRDRLEIGDTLLTYVCAAAMNLGVEPDEVLDVLRDSFDQIDWDDLRRSLVVGGMELTA